MILDGGALALAAQRIQNSGMLGASRSRRLFDYLLSTSLAGHSPKEAAIAVDVFGRDASFDVSQNSLVRVYVHKIRKALEAFYAEKGDAGMGVIHIPRGEYRLRLKSPGLALLDTAGIDTDQEISTAAASIAMTPTPAVLTSTTPPSMTQSSIAPSSMTVSAATPAAITPSRLRETPWWSGIRKLAIVLASLLLAAALGASGMLWWHHPPAKLAQVASSPVWAPFFNDTRPIIIVVGDYYLIGDTEGTGNVKRLVREYSVNSRADLDNYLLTHPEANGHYVDAGLQYLPVSTALALRDVMSVLAPVEARISVGKISDVSSTELKSADIIYVGMLSRLRVIQGLAPSGARFLPGATSDEVFDRQSQHVYASQAGRKPSSPPDGLANKETAPHHDYGVVTEFQGPAGNHVLVIAGTRDEGTEQTAYALTHEPELSGFGKLVNLANPFEALVEVTAVDGMVLNSRVVSAAPR